VRTHLSDLELPAAWEWRPLWQLVQPGRPITYGIVQAGPDVTDGVPYIRPVDMTDEHGLKHDIEPQRTTAEIAAAYKRSVIKTDDLVVSIGPSYGKVMLVPPDLAGANLTQGTARVAPDREVVDGRYLKWALRSLPVRDAWATSVGGATFGGLNLGPLADSLLPVPPLEVQRRIADYLDTATARIDHMLTKNEQLLRLGAERWGAMVEQRLSSTGPMVKLQYVSDLTPGYAYPSSEFEDSGEYRLLRGVNVGTGSLRWGDVVYGSSSLVASTPEYALRAGDIVFGMDRPWISTGLRAARVEAKDLPCFLVQRVLRLRPHTHRLAEDFLLLWLQTGRFFADFEPEMTGISVPHVSGGQVGSARVPLPAVGRQRQIVDEMHEERLAWLRAGSAVRRQSTLLVERRQALITAAVTGELEV
jgi:type I restriction enzyme S subunit